MENYKLVYAFDPLCGWCFGAIPALRALQHEMPDLNIELILGGLITGERIGPYSAMSDYIKRASINLEKVTGRQLSEAFFQDILSNEDVICSSIEPSIVIDMVRQKYPERTLEFAFAVQEAHFLMGEDLNKTSTYESIFNSLDIEIPLSVNDLSAPAMIANVEQEFENTRRLGMNSFPTAILVDMNTNTKMPLPSEYNPEQFVQKVRHLISPVA